MKCPVCDQQNLSSLSSHERPFHHCRDCDYIFQNPESRLQRPQEEARYLEHNNDLEDPRYLKYLEKTWSQVESPKPGAFVLDYGCGPARGLEAVLRDSEFRVASYDPIFWPRDLEQEFGKVDVLFCSEVIEHIYEPAKIFSQWNQLLKPDGVITLRTGFHPGADNMSDWWYASDETHIGFFNETTFEFIAEKWGWTLIKVHGPYVVASKKDHSGFS